MNRSAIASATISLLERDGRGRRRLCLLPVQRSAAEHQRKAIASSQLIWTNRTRSICDGRSRRLFDPLLLFRLRRGGLKLRHVGLVEWVEISNPLQISRCDPLS